MIGRAMMASPTHGTLVQMRPVLGWHSHEGKRRRGRVQRKPRMQWQWPVGRLPSPTVLQTAQGSIQDSALRPLPISHRIFRPSALLIRRVPLRRAFCLPSQHFLARDVLGPWLLLPPRQLQSFSPWASLHKSSSRELPSALLSWDQVQRNQPSPCLCLSVLAFGGLLHTLHRTARRHRRPTTGEPRDGQALAQFILNRCSDCSQPLSPIPCYHFRSLPPPSGLLQPTHPSISPLVWSEVVIWPFLTLSPPTPVLLPAICAGSSSESTTPSVEDGETHQPLAAIQDREGHARPVFHC